MKQLTVVFALLLGFGMMSSVQAQSCQKSASACCKKSASTASADKAMAPGTVEAAAKLASLDASIETRTCDKSGSVSYVRKVKDETTGAVTYADVAYDQELGQFVNVSPKTAKACCAKAVSSGCCAGKKSSVAETRTEEQDAAKQPVKEVKSTTPAPTQTKAQKGS